MLRRAHPFLVTLSTLTLAASGCVTNAGSYQACRTNDQGNCEQNDAMSAVFGLGAILLIGGIYYVVTDVSRSRAPKARVAPVDRTLAGRVRWQGSFEGASSLRVTLRRTQGPVLLETTTDADGRFAFPLPRKTDWYVVALDGARAEGETSVWVQDRPPEPFEVLARPPSTETVPDRPPLE